MKNWTTPKIKILEQSQAGNCDGGTAIANNSAMEDCSPNGVLAADRCGGGNSASNGCNNNGSSAFVCNATGNLAPQDA